MHFLLIAVLVGLTVCQTQAAVAKGVKFDKYFQSVIPERQKQEVEILPMPTIPHADIPSSRMRGNRFPTKFYQFEEHKTPVVRMSANKRRVAHPIVQKQQYGVRTKPTPKLRSRGPINDNRGMVEMEAIYDRRPIERKQQITKPSTEFTGLGFQPYFGEFQKRAGGFISGRVMSDVSVNALKYKHLQSPFFGTYEPIDEIDGAYEEQTPIFGDVGTLMEYPDLTNIVPGSLF